MTRCQLCGRRFGLTRAGVIPHHHVRGSPCGGAGHPPIEQDDAQLERAVAASNAEATRLSREYAALLEARANWIDPALIHAAAAATTLSLRLDRRLTRHRNWPARFARQMERDGMGDPPPQYLRDRAHQGGNDAD